MTVNRAQFTALLEPTLNNIKGDDDYPRKAYVGTSLYNVTTSQKAQETDFQYAGLGDFQVKNEGGPVVYSDPLKRGTKAYQHVRRSLGYQITQEMLDHDQYAEIRKLEMALQIAGDDDIEIQAFLLLNNGFVTTASGGFSATGFDGLALFSTAHTRIDGGTAQANKPSTDASLDWTSLSNGVIQFMSWRDNRGRPITSIPQRLIIHPNDIMTAKELLNSMGKPGTPNNEVNALRDWNLDLVTSLYITDTNSWFLQGAQHDARWFWDVNPRTGSEDNWELEVVKRKRVQGWSNGHGDWVGFYGTTGTT
jgi:hypothetical protein